jgi:sensor domain CHASE-containing protein
MEAGPPCRLVPRIVAGNYGMCIPWRGVNRVFGGSMAQGRRYSRFMSGEAFSSRLGALAVPALGVLDALFAWALGELTVERIGADVALPLMALAAGALVRGQFRRGRALALSGGVVALVLILFHGLSSPLSPLFCAVLLLVPGAMVFGSRAGAVRAVTRGMATATLFTGMAYLAGALTEPAVISDAHPTLLNTLALVWLGWSFTAIDRRRPWTVSLVTPVVLSGLGWMGLLGCLIYLVRPLSGDTGFAPITFDNSLAFVLMGHALWLLARRRPGAAWRVGLLCIPLAVISLIATQLGRPDFMAALLLPEGGAFAEVMDSGQFLPVTAIALLLAEFGLIAGSLVKRHHAWSSALWGSGLLVTIAGGLSLIGYLVRLRTGGSAEGSHLPILMPVAVGMLVLGFGLLASNPRSPWERRYRTFVFPAVMGFLTVALSVLLWRSLDTQQSRLEQRAINSRNETLVTAISSGMTARVSALERMAVRFAHMPANLRSGLFGVDAAQYLHDMPSLRGLVYADADRVVEEVLTRFPTQAKKGVHLDLTPARKLVFERADQSGQAQLSAPLTLLSGIEGEMIVVPVRAGGELKGYVVSSVEFDRMFPSLLASMQGEYLVRISQGRRLLYAHGNIPRGMPALSADIPMYGQQWHLETYANPEQLSGLTPRFVLLLGFALGGLLAVALRLSALSRERARLAEEVATKLGEQVKAREAAQSALVESEHKMLSVLESITDGVLVVDRQWCYTYVNPQAARMLDADETSLVGRSCLSAFPDVKGNELAGSWVIDAWKRAVQKNMPVTLETPYDFGQRWYGMRAYPHRDGLTVYLQDISTRKHHERELKQRDVEYRHAQALAHHGSWELHM